MKKKQRSTCSLTNSQIHFYHLNDVITLQFCLPFHTHTNSNFLRKIYQGLNKYCVYTRGLISRVDFNYVFKIEVSPEK